MTKATIKPYYKYKRNAYKKIQDVARLFLKENNFFIRTGLPPDITITFRGDLRGSFEDVINFYIRGDKVLTILGSRVIGKSGYDTRDFLTTKEYSLSTPLVRLYRCFLEDPSWSTILLMRTVSLWEMVGINI